MVYKLSLSRMPDENTNPIATNQTSQNDQVSTDQSWNDFVLDFWDIGNNTGNEDSVVEMDNIETEQAKNEEESDSKDVEFDSWELFGDGENEETGNNSENKIEIQNDEKNDWNENDDFTISFDNATKVDSQDDTNENVDDDISSDFSENLGDKNEENIGDNNNFEETESNVVENNSSDSVNLEFSEDSQVKEGEIYDGDNVVRDDNITENEVVEEIVDNEDEKVEDIFSEQSDNDSKEDNIEIPNENVQEDVSIENNGGDVSIENEKAEDDFVFDLWGDNNVAENDIIESGLVEDKIVNNEDDRSEGVIQETKDSNPEEDDSEVFNENLQKDVNINDGENSIIDDKKDGEAMDFDILNDDVAENNVADNNVMGNDVVENTDVIENDTKGLEISEGNSDGEMSLNINEDEWEKILNNGTEVNMSGWEFTVESENEGSTGLPQEESTNVDLSFTLDDGEQQSLKQPELGDLLWNSSVDFLEEHETNVGWIENNLSWEANQESTTNQENVDFVPETNNESSPVQDSNDSMDNNVVNQVFTLDAQGSSGDELQKDITSETSNENSEWVNNEIVMQSSKDENVRDVNAVQETMTQTNQMESWPQQITSTLSLDQILDTELNSDPQFADNSKAVPVNVSNKGGKKMVWIVAWIWLFMLAWMVAVLAFPSGSLGNKPWDSVNTGENMEINVDYDENEYDDHNVAGTEDNEWTIDQSWWKTSHTTNVTVQQSDLEFPDVDYENNSEDENQINEDPENINPIDSIVPYVCDWENCPGVDEDQVQIVELRDVANLIRDFKSQAENYYSEWDELQDKKLIKYSLQLTLLCDNYQTKTKNGEWLDEESFSSFKSKGESLLDKMEKYLENPGWENYQ